MDAQLKQILKIIKKTGDKIIVMSEAEEDSFVIMDLRNYESLISSNPQEKALGSSYNNSQSETTEDLTKGASGDMMEGKGSNLDPLEAPNAVTPKTPGSVQSATPESDLQEEVSTILTGQEKDKDDKDVYYNEPLE